MVRPMPEIMHYVVGSLALLEVVGLFCWVAH